MGREIDAIVIHHSASSKDVSAVAIKKYHMEERGYSDVGYHFLIEENGQIVEGRPLDRDGAHAHGHNKGSIGICVIGNFDEDFLSPPQMLALTALIEHFCDLYSLDNQYVFGHSELEGVDPTACPGRHLLGFLRAYRSGHKGY